MSHEVPNDPHRRIRRRRLWLLSAMFMCVALLVLFDYRVMKPVQGLGNNDVAGIVYNASLIVDGGLPYVNSVEIKPPGSFFLVAAAFSTFGRDVDVLHNTATLWMLLGAVGAWLAAFRLYRSEGENAVFFANFAGCLYVIAASKFAANYAAWMATPYTWAVTCTIFAVTSPETWRGRALHAAAGGMACTAYLFKNHAVVLGLFIILTWAWARYNKRPGGYWSAWPAWAVGIIIALTPIVTTYAVAGGLSELLGGILPLEQAGRYVDRRVEAPLWDIIWKLHRQTHSMFPLALSLSEFTLLGSLFLHLSRRFRGLKLPSKAPLLPVILLVFLGFVGCGLGGMRYYGHYLVQYCIGLSLLGAHPLCYRFLASLRGYAPSWSKLPLWHRRLRIVLCLLLLIPSWGFYVRVHRVFDGRNARDYRPGIAPQVIGELIKDATNPKQTIFCWGWRTWAIYFWADRRSPVPLYKSLGTLTEFNNNGKFRPPRTQRDRHMEFIPGPHADSLYRAFRDDPPAFVIRAKKFFPGIRNDPMKQHKEIYKIWSEQYVKVKTYRHMVLYRHQNIEPLEMERKRGGGHRGKTKTAAKPVKKPKSPRGKALAKAAPGKRPADKRAPQQPGPRASAKPSRPGPRAPKLPTIKRPDQPSVQPAPSGTKKQATAPPAKPQTRAAQPSVPRPAAKPDKAHN